MVIQMKINRVILISFSTALFLSNVQAKLVQVSKLRGNATFLSNGMREAKKLELNQWLDKDTSILTADKTFVLLRYANGSEITLGPNSKIVVDYTQEKDQQLVGLLIGKFKASIKKTQDLTKEGGNKEVKNKLIIKTAGAALGVRGTIFQTNYNPETKITSLVTFEGAVAMTPITVENKKVEEKLNAESVVVKTGEFSGVSESTEVVTAPVKIATEQFTKLKLNETLGAVEQKIDEKKFALELKKTEEIYAKTKDDKKETTLKDVHELRSGGYVDDQTGIYLPPPKTASFNQELNIYKAPENMGKINQDGAYVPPVGIKIDPRAGLVLDSENANAEAKAVVEEFKEAILIQVDPEAIKQPTIKKKKMLEKESDVYKKYYDPTKL